MNLESLSFHSVNPSDLGYGSSCGGPPTPAAKVFVPLGKSWPRLRITALGDASDAYTVLRCSPHPDDYWDRVQAPDYIAPEIQKLLIEAQDRLAMGRDS